MKKPVFLVLLLAFLRADAVTVYVSPDGRTDAAYTRADPGTIEGAEAKIRSVRPSPGPDWAHGDEVILLAGEYAPRNVPLTRSLTTWRADAGATATLAGPSAGAARAFDVKGSANVLFRDLRFTGFTSSGDGGAVSCNPIMSCPAFRNCTFENCRAKGCGGALQGGFASNCTFRTCRAARGGAWFGTRVGGFRRGALTDCVFEGCEAVTGGALALPGEVSNCMFRNCRAACGGGAVWVSDDLNGALLRDCAFTGNFADGDGGAVHGGTNSLYGCGTLLGCRFEGNCAEVSGGACKSVNALSNCTFTANVARTGQGGAVDGVRGDRPYLVSGCIFRGNAAARRQTQGHDPAIGGVPTVSADTVVEDSLRRTCGRTDGKPGLAQVVMRPGDDFLAVRDRLRRERAPDGTRVEVILEDGVYELTDEVELSGVDAFSTWRARHPGRATVVGGWTARGRDAIPVDDPGLLDRLPPEARPFVRRLQVPDAVAALFKPGSLPLSECGMAPDEYVPDCKDWGEGGLPVFSVDAEAQILARYPNEGALQLIGRGNCLGTSEGGKLAFKCNSPRAAKWDLADADPYFAGYPDACAYLMRIFPLCRDARTGGFTLAVAGNVNGMHGNGYFCNILEEIDRPGEWCYHAPSKSIVFYPPETFGDGSLLAVGTARRNLFRITGDGIALEGLVLTTKRAEPAVAVYHAEGTRLSRCRFSACAYTALFMAGRRGRIEDCAFDRNGGPAVYLHGGVARTLERGDNVMERCRVSGCEYRTIGCCKGSVHVQGVGNTVRDCDIGECVKHALDYVGFDHLIENCRFRFASLEYGDSAAVYAPGGNQSYGCVFRNNEISGSNAYGIYLDDCSSGHTVTNNLIRDCGGFGVFVGGGRDNTVAGNRILGCGGGIHLDNRGLFWGQWSKPEAIHRRFIADYDYTNAPFATRYPRWAKWHDDGAKMFGYQGCAFRDNLIADVGGVIPQYLDFQLCAPDGDPKNPKWTVPTNRVESRGNVLVRRVKTHWPVTAWTCFGGYEIREGTAQSPASVDVPGYTGRRPSVPSGWPCEEYALHPSISGDRTAKDANPLMHIRRVRDYADDRATLTRKDLGDAASEDFVYGTPDRPVECGGLAHCRYVARMRPWGQEIAVHTSPDGRLWTKAVPVLSLPSGLALKKGSRPEVRRLGYPYGNTFGMLVTLVDTRDGRQEERLWIFQSQSPLGPFRSIAEGGRTPEEWRKLETGVTW